MAKGYALHDQRIAQSGGLGSTRSIKYELTAPLRVYQAVVDAIENDGRQLYGDNISTTTHKTVIRFWLQALTLGAVFGYSAIDLQKNVDLLSAKKSAFEKAFVKIILKNELDMAKWCAFVAKPKRGLETKTHNRLMQDIFRLLNKPETPSEAINKIAKEYADNIVNIPYNDHPAYIVGLFGASIEQIERPTVNLTFVFLPSLLDNHVSSTPTEQIESALNMQSLLYGNATAASIDTKTALQLIGIGNNGNALYSLLHGVFKNLAIKNGDELKEYKHNLLDAMDTMISYTQTERTMVAEHIDELGVTAKEIGMPCLVGSWADYRSDISGKIQSWFSNRTRMKNELTTQIAQLGQDLSILREHLDAINNFPKQFGVNVDTAKRIVQRMQSAGLDQIGFNDIIALQSLLSEIRRDANFWYQEFWNELRAAKKIKARKLDLKKQLPSLFSSLQNLPRFFGELKPQQFERFRQTKKLLNDYRQDMLTIGDELVGNLSKMETIEPKDLERFLDWARKAQSKEGRIIGNRIAILCGIKLKQLDDKQHYYISSFNKDSVLQKVESPTVSSINLHAVWRVYSDWLKLITLVPESNIDLHDANELWRRLIPIFMQYSKTDKVDSDLFTKFSQESQEFMLVFDTRIITYPILQRLTQNHIASNFKGLLATLSRKEFIVRSCVQAQSGEQSTLLRDTKTGDFRMQINANIPDLLPMQSDTLVTICKSTEKQRFEIAKFKPNNGPVMNIKVPFREHHYKLQFLNWFFAKPKRKKCELKMGGSFVISERVHKIDWTGDEPVLAIRPARIFASVPFTLIPPTTAELSFIEGRYIGLDIGASYVMYNVIEIKGKNARTIDKGIIEDNRFVLLAEAVAKHRIEQIKGTYTMPTHHVMRLREALVGTLQNKIHALALKHGAKVVYEGGGLTPDLDKVYLPLKRTDTWPDLTDVTRAAHKQAWGKGKLQTGLIVSSQATSQTCTRCKRWFQRQIDFDRKEPYKLESVPGMYFIKSARLEKARLYIYAEKNEVTPYELKLGAQRFMLPPEKGEALKLAGAEIPAGHEGSNHSIFICPFADCMHVSHSDRQAAFTIALRGYIKDHKPKGDEIDWEAEMQKFEFVAESI